MKIFKPEDFGAKADGINNDAVSLWKAIAAASEAEEESLVLLQSDKTYYIAPTEEQKEANNFVRQGYKQNVHSLDCLSAIALADTKNVHIKGENTKLLLEPPFFYCSIYNCENITIEGLVFDYRYRPFAKAELIELDAENHKAIMKTDRSLHITERVTGTGFSILERPDARYHMRSKAFTPIDAENFIYEVEFSDEPITNSRLEQLRVVPLIVPVPNFGHTIERSFSIIGNKNVTVKDCKVYSIPRFGFVLFNNDGTVCFDNLRVQRPEDESACIVSWRDLFHVKENHAKYIWKNCYAEYCYDDIFNISASTLTVQNVYAEDDIDFKWPEKGGVYSGVRVGDTVSIVDYDTGIDYGNHKIKEIVSQQGSHNRLRLETPVKGIANAKNTKVHILEMVAPGTIIENCDFRGTFRLRGPIEVKDTHFEVKRFWIDTFYVGNIGEGPVPKHIHFTNCKFECDDTVNKYFHIESQRNDSVGEPQYHLEDIVFKNCDIPMDTLDIGEIDKPYVKFI